MYRMSRRRGSRYRRRPRRVRSGLVFARQIRLELEELDVLLKNVTTAYLECCLHQEEGQHALDGSDF